MDRSVRCGDAEETRTEAHLNLLHQGKNCIEEKRGARDLTEVLQPIETRLKQAYRLVQVIVMVVVCPRKTEARHG